MQKEKGKILTQASANQIKNEAILHFDYGYKEKGMWVTADGRIMFAVDKAEIRNRSLTGYIWWKVVSDSSVNMYYATGSDPEIAAMANRIIGQIETKGNR